MSTEEASSGRKEAPPSHLQAEPHTAKAQLRNQRSSYSSLSPAVHQRPGLPTFARRGKLRKTNSEPTDISIDECDQVKVEKIQDILNSLNFAKFHVGSSVSSQNVSGFVSGRSSPSCLTSPASGDLEEVWTTPRSSFHDSRKTRARLTHVNYDDTNSPSESDFIATDIEELKDAALSIEVLSRRSRHKPSSPGPPSSVERATSSPRIPSLSIPGAAVSCSAPSSATLPRSGGITSRIGGHPRGVIQFLPSVKGSEFLSQTAYESYIASKERRQRINSGPLDDDETETIMPHQHLPPSYASGGQVHVYPQHSGLPLSIQTPDEYTIGDNPAPLRRKISMPDRFYGNTQVDLVIPQPISAISRAPRASHMDSYQYPSTSGEYDLRNAYLVKERKVSSPLSYSTLDRNKKVGRFASFAQGTNRHEDDARKLSRQLSQHDKTLSDSEGSFHHPSLKGAESLAGFSRFSKLLKSLRASRQNSPENDPALSPASSDSPLSSPGPSESHPGPHIGLSRSWHGGRTLAAGPGGVLSDSDSSFMQADLMVWRKRSKGSLRRHEDTRTHVVKEIFDTESSYVENLQLMVNKYLRPLKRPELCALIDSSLVDEIFYQIPEILGHHELFFAALKSRLDNWDSRQKIGDIILNNFAKQSVIDTYTAFINNWKSAKHAIRTASQTKSAFAKYLEELLKHTSVEHPDHQLLTRAQKEIHDLATKINHVEQEAGLSEQMQQRLREIEAIVDGLDDLVSIDRIFYRYDLVTVIGPTTKKERCLFLFSDQLLITNVKRKSSAALRKSAVLMSPSGHNFLENHKFKLLMKVSLDDLETEKKNLPLLSKIHAEVKQLQDDLRVLGKMTELASLLRISHDVRPCVLSPLKHSAQSNSTVRNGFYKEDLEGELGNLKDGIRKELGEKQEMMTTDPLLTSLDLMITTEEGVETVTVAFLSADKRVSWEKCFNDAKDALVLSFTKRPPPTFLKPVSLQRTRAGLHFTCASATLGKNEYGCPNVWICNSDGYVGQVCILNIPEPDIISCNGITNSTINCIAAVPVAKMNWQDFLKQQSTALIKRSRKTSSTVPDKIPENSNPEVTSLSSAKLDLESDSSDNDDSTEPNSESKSSKSPSSSTPILNGAGDGITLEIEKEIEEDQVPTMWLGTDDGSYVDDRVFVALGSREILFYTRDTDGNWNLGGPKSVELSETLRSPVSCMLLVTSRLWFASLNQIFVLNPHSLQLEHSFQVSSDSNCAITCMTTSGLGVWIAMQGSPVMKLFHALTFECLWEINVSPTITKTLAGCDDIIRQHKLSKPRVTALLCCKDLLWAGTSAGVILTLPLPHLSHNSTKLSNLPNISVCSVGHSGQCRFLAQVDLQSGLLSRSGSHTGSFTSPMNELSKRRMSLNVAALQQGKIYVVSGGDGFEDFQDVSTDDGDDSSGKEDSTNHLLIWQV